MASGGDGRLGGERERARGGDGDEGKVREGSGQLCGDAGRLPGRREAGRQGGGGRARAGARRPRTRPSGARRKTTEVGWWAGPACYRAGPEVSASSYFPFPIFFSVSFVLHLCLINKNARAFL